MESQFCFSPRILARAVLSLALALLLIFAVSACAEDAGTTLQSGQTIQFGTWQGSPLKWIILDLNGSDALLLCTQGVATEPYNVESKDVTWETCTLRSWLNNDFYLSAFSYAQQVLIQTAYLQNPVTYGTEGGADTADKVFLLSRAEIETYLPVLNDRKATGFPGTEGYLAPTDSTIMFWLRSPGVDNKHACAVNWTGVIESRAVKATAIYVRPAIRVDLQAAGLL